MSREELGHRILHGYVPFVGVSVRVSGFTEDTFITGKVQKRMDIVVLDFFANPGLDSGNEDAYIPNDAKIIIPEGYRPTVKTNIPVVYTYESNYLTYSDRCAYVTLYPSGEMGVPQVAGGILKEMRIPNVAYEISESTL